MKEKKQNEVWKRLKRKKIAVVAMFILLALFLMAIFAPLLAPYGYEEADLSRGLEKSSREHLLGTDRLGRDTLSRLIYGSRQSLQIGIIALTSATLLGVFVGSIAGYYGGFVDNAIMRFLDLFNGIPMFLLTVTLAAVLGPSLRNAIIAIAIAMWPGSARLMRASILSVREMEYIEAAKSNNANVWRIILRHIVPNAIAPVLVSYTMGMGMSVLQGASLSFIGLGVQPPIPEWGAMISDARSLMRSQPQLAIYPGILVMVTVLAFNMLGDGLRDALDPRLKD
ncbi:MAG: ABC transporter permease [Oscillospiraceae bacterium]|jgi:peptide/nickel transport system permease protein|nr:ABC transporter permease [Oscillospiraceae bacterium]